MSYCRFSSENWTSDVYAYQAEEGFVVHVASSRLVGDIPSVPTLGTVADEEWLAAHQRQMAALETAERVRINGPYDGQTFTESSALDLGVWLLDIAEKGYRVPQYALDALKEEDLEEEAPREANN